MRHLPATEPVAKQMSMRLLVIAFALWPSVQEGVSVCHWDDEYSVAISVAKMGLSQNEAILVENLFATSRAAWTKNSDYAWVREEIGRLREVRDMIRVEGGNANASAYEVMWLVQASSGFVLLTNAQQKREHKEISQQLWQGLITKIQKADVLALHSSANTAVDDGTSYFISLCIGGRSHQVVVYGLPSHGSEGIKHAEKYRVVLKAVRDLNIAIP
jgi:hypothetical protein